MQIIWAMQIIEEITAIPKGPPSPNRKLISITHILSKVNEKLVYHNLSDFCNKYRNPSFNAANDSCMFGAFVKFTLVEVKGTLPAENNFFIICFYAIMHRTTIVPNKSISIICSCLFICPANIYRPSLEKVWIGRPNSTPLQRLNFYLRRKKKHSNQNCMHYKFTTLHCLIFNFDFHLFKKKSMFFFSKKRQIFYYIYYYYNFF